MPGKHWRKATGTEAWQFDRRQGELLFHLAEAASEPLRVVFEALGRTARYRFSFRWNSEILGYGRQALGKGPFVLEVPPEYLTAGTHRLQLERRYELDRRWVKGARRESFFSKVSFELGKATGVLDWSREDAYETIRDFLRFGIAGSGPEKRSGILLSGPGVRTLPFSVATTPARLETVVDNISDGAAEFWLARGGEEASTVVAAGETRRLVLEMQPGDEMIELGVEGEPDGLFLFGQPYLVRESGEERPPIVLITLDTTRRDALSPYGGRAELTPRLGDFARRATVFESAFSTSPWTLPGHALHVHRALSE